MKKQLIYTMVSVAMLGAASCSMDIANPNAPKQEDVTTTREGLITSCIGTRQFYATSGVQTLVTATGTTTRELKGISTFTNVLELEAGGTALPTFNSNVLGLWANMLRVMGDANDILANAPAVLSEEANLRSGIVAFGSLMKAMAITGLATAYEQFPIETSKENKAAFVTRTAAMEHAVDLLDKAVTELAANPPSSEFNSRVIGADFVLIDVINVYRARLNLMLGKNPQALAAANAVNLNSKSEFKYSSQSPNPIQQQVQVSKNFRARADFGLPAGFVEAGDARLDFYLTTPDAVVGGETLKTLKGFAVEIGTSIPVYIPDEVHLIKAEAIIRSGGDLNTAKTEIDAVRTQAGGDPFGVNAKLPAYSGPVTTTALLLEVYKQRSIELYLQGLRLEDSRRFGRPAPPQNVNPVPVSNERTRNWYPYPDQERLNNPNTPADPAI
ncbi:RagB/SusD family nutrient uptake outer membrane protein [Chitinophaga lutea]